LKTIGARYTVSSFLVFPSFIFCLRQSAWVCGEKIILAADGRRTTCPAEFNFSLSPAPRTIFNISVLNHRNDLNHLNHPNNLNHLNHLNLFNRSCVQKSGAALQKTQHPLTRSRQVATLD
jgi:hypothetical protein